MWINDAVLYQIYPLGFVGAPIYNDGIQAHGILKVIDWIPHLLKLGINGVYFSPVFESDKHGYDTRDYKKIDVRLGTNEDFQKVCEELHGHGIKVILDGVFNHVGRGFFAFQDVLKNKKESKYAGWFKINFDGNSCYNDGFYYEAWEGHYELPALNLTNGEVREYLFDAIRYWREYFGIDGLRLDVSYCLDRYFLQCLRGYADTQSDFALIGEVLFGDYRLLVNNSMLHSCTNYESYKSLYSAINSNNLFEISYSVNRQFGYAEWTMYKGLHLVTFVDNHDVSRIATILNDKRNINIVYALLFTFPGIPTIYYGSEWGAEGNKRDGDEALRPCFGNFIENKLFEYISLLSGIRSANKIFSLGGYRNLVENNRFFAYERKDDKDVALVAVNISEEEITVYNPAFNGEFEEMTDGTAQALCGKIIIPPHCAKIYLSK